MLPRTLEPEIMDSIAEAEEYDAMDHAAVNQTFARDFLAVGEVGTDCLDLGTGTALIPIEICKRNPSIRIMALDASIAMLERARYRLELIGEAERIQLHHGNVHSLVFASNFFDSVISNTLLHHLPNPEKMLAEAWRVLRQNGLLFIRDLVRPNSEDEVEKLVELHTLGESNLSKQLLRQSFHAALTLEEIRGTVAELGLPPSTVQMTSDRHWTLCARRIS